MIIEILQFLNDYYQLICIIYEKVILIIKAIFKESICQKKFWFWIVVFNNMHSYEKDDFLLEQFKGSYCKKYKMFWVPEK